MDLFNKKLCWMMALMLHWPMLLAAMDVWDAPHFASTIPANSAESWSHLAEPRDLPLNQHGDSLIDKKYTTTSGQDHPDVFNTRDGSMDNRWSADENREQRSIFQEEGEEIQSHEFLSGSPIASPWRDTDLSNLPPSDAHKNMFGEWTGLEDLFGSGEKSSREHQHEHEHAHHRDLSQDDVFNELTNLVPIPALEELHHYLLSSPHTSSSSPARSYHDFATIGSPGLDTTLYKDTNSMSHLDSFVPPSFSEHTPSGALHNEDFQMNSLHESNPESSSDSQAQVMEALSQHDHIQKPPAFSNIPSTQSSQSSSDYRFLDEILIGSPERHVGHDLGVSDSDTLASPESQTFHGERISIPHDISSQPHPLSPSSPVSHGLESFEKYLEHLTHGTSHNIKPLSPISETKRGSARSLESSRESSIPLDSTLRELDSIPPLDDLPNFGELSTDLHTHFPAMSEEHSAWSERTPSASLETESRKNSKDASDVENSDGTASSKLVEWKNNKMEIDRADSEIPSEFLLGLMSRIPKTDVVLVRSLDEKDLNQDMHITTSHNKKLPIQDILESSSRSGQLKRPSQTDQLDSQPSKQKTRHDPFSFDDHDRSISQVRGFSTSPATEIHTTDSSTLPSPWTSLVANKPRPTVGWRSGLNFGFEKPREHETVSKNFDSTHSKDMDIETYHARTWPDEKLNEKTSMYSERIPRFPKSLRSTNTLPQAKVKLNFVNHHSISPRDIIDKFQPEILEFMESISIQAPDPLQTKHVTDNMEKLWDNYLEMIASCSKMISSKRISTDLEQDLEDAHHWIAEQWKNIPGIKLDWYPLRDRAQPVGKVHDEYAFVEKFSVAASTSIHEGTVFWLSHPMYRPTREHVATVYVMRFMSEKRKNWLQILKPKKAETLGVKTLLTKMKNIKPLRYPSTDIRARKPRVRKPKGEPLEITN
ncbi:uncharacterized protein MELLADRAFT_93971 [Melampsora larici-populina 98AG31]|uniref:Secreted protein n=1 Tax=Melampsora larici-populina (strain 98AG31 / pathotype 3-4-7) TaxID=747676 RepID=F4S5Y2_MELLP|nr:uncharacterized protein MELLADRAFT_93971 [Melampsora larici-populina 98AG31]EGF99982.1 hypothetical protein MELLADRAFT_93971 [Melampsora larici-populina 98AG31]